MADQGKENIIQNAQLKRFIVVIHLNYGFLSSHIFGVNNTIMCLVPCLQYLYHKHSRFKVPMTRNFFCVNISLIICKSHFR